MEIPREEEPDKGGDEGGNIPAFQSNRQFGGYVIYSRANSHSQPEAAHRMDLSDPFLLAQIRQDEVVPGEQDPHHDGDDEGKDPNEPPGPTILADDNVEVEDEE